MPLVLPLKNSQLNYSLRLRALAALSAQGFDDLDALTDSIVRGGHPYQVTSIGEIERRLVKSKKVNPRRMGL
jgi:hypothetical protein